MAWQLKVPSGSRYEMFSIPLRPEGIGRALAYTWDVLAPLPAARIDFWGKNLLHDALPGTGAYIRVLLGLAVTIACLWTLRRRAAAWTLFLVTAGGVWLSIQKETGGLRHHGHLLMAFVGASWILAWQGRSKAKAGAAGEGPPAGGEPALAYGSRPNGPKTRSPGAPLFAAVCILQFFAGAHASVMDWIYPFSGSAEAAELVRQQVPPDALVIAHRDFAGAAVAARLNRPFLYVESNTRGTHIDFNRQRERRVEASALVELTLREASQSGRTVFLLLNREPNLPNPFPVGNLVGRTRQTAIQSDEVYLLYAVAPPPGPTSAPVSVAASAPASALAR
jgi:hypothetical protein